MSDCCTHEFERGGVIVETTISRSTIDNSTITNSVFDSGSITYLNEMDGASAATVATALSKLTPDELNALAQALKPLIMPKIMPHGTASSVGTNVPTTIYGGREAMMGQPVGWLELNGYIVPAYDI